MSVDVEGAHTADTLAAVVVEHDGLLASLDERLVQDVEGLEEGSVGSGLDSFISHKTTFSLRAGLTPDLKIDFHYIFFHCEFY